MISHKGSIKDITDPISSAAGNGLTKGTKSNESPDTEKISSTNAIVDDDPWFPETCILQDPSHIKFQELDTDSTKAVDIVTQFLPGELSPSHLTAAPRGTALS